MAAFSVLFDCGGFPVTQEHFVSVLPDCSPSSKVIVVLVLSFKSIQFLFTNLCAIDKTG